MMAIAKKVLANYGPGDAMYIPFDKVHNIGFISTRFAGTDGVSLETKKWARVLEKERFHCFYFAGELDLDPAQS